MITMGTHASSPGFFATKSGDVASGKTTISFTSESSHETLSLAVADIIQITANYLPVETMINDVLTRTFGQQQYNTDVLGEVSFPGLCRLDMNSFTFSNIEVSAWITGDGSKYLFSIAAGDAGMIGTNLSSILEVVKAERDNPMGPFTRRQTARKCD